MIRHLPMAATSVLVALLFVLVGSETDAQSVPTPPGGD
eukprot:SAG31_NODE_6789_length_1887_cov_3.646532_1_plen_37_part_10